MPATGPMKGEAALLAGGTIPVVSWRQRHGDRHQPCESCRGAA